ncbi:MAG: hypothetical protein ACKOKC_08965 [Chthoniobacterales bacterium]
MKKFYPGQRVVCIDARFAPDVWEWTNRVPVEGEVYTVSAVVDCPHRVSGKYGGGLRLVEVDTAMPGSTTAPRLNWDVSRFIPLGAAETKSVAKKKRRVAKKRRALQPALA